MSSATDKWSSNFGVILAVAGSAVGFGNFLRFPGLAAQFGGGAFMIAYFIGLLLVGIPLAWIDWSMGRRAGSLGGHSPSSSFYLLSGSALWKYLGILGVLAPLIVAMYYLYIEGWALGYAYHSAMGNLQFAESSEFSQFFLQFTGATADGSSFNRAESSVLAFFGLALIANMFLLYRGISKGIEWFCKWSMPMLLITAVIILVRVLTLGTPDASHPERSINAGLGYMWNPDKIMLEVEGKTVAMLPSQKSPELQAAYIEKVAALHPGKEIIQQRIAIIDGLLNPDLWVSAIGQIFFSLSVGFGSICTYASYLSRKNDIALSSILANSANEVVEVSIAGMMIVPAAVSFLGVVAAAGASTFGLGFEVLPQVFAQMPGGKFFGTLFFLLLALAAITSSISQIQPAIAFVEEYWNLKRRQSVVLIGGIVCIGSGITAWYTSNGLIALDTLDFFFGTLCIYLVCSMMVYIFRNKWTTKKGIEELELGALIKLPRMLSFVINWITPSILLFIFASWLYKNIFVEQCIQIKRVIALEPGAIIPLLWAACVGLLFIFIVKTSNHCRVDKLAELEEEQFPPTSKEKSIP